MRNDKLYGVEHITIYAMHINLNEQKAKRFLEDERKRKNLAKTYIMKMLMNNT